MDLNATDHRKSLKIEQSPSIVILAYLWHTVSIKNILTLLYIHCEQLVLHNMELSNIPMSRYYRLTDINLFKYC